ncbi:MAG: BrnT family toxin [Chloroflexi bacterium]|nr:BrnT family toxin [Chloroflexota bacterium]
MQFEWDDWKNLANIEKHGVSFEEAVEAFLDPNRKVAFDPGHSDEEERYFCFGRVRDRVMTVRFTLRGGNVRIIGAGYWREGRRKYEHG